MSDIETSTETRPAADDPSQEPARKRQRLSHYPSMVDVVDEPKGDLVMKVGQHEEDFGLVRVHKVSLNRRFVCHPLTFAGYSHDGFSSPSRDTIKSRA
jgi:hypothetical protein